VIDGQFVVTEGSLARAKDVDSLRACNRALRRHLTEAGVLAPRAGSTTQLVFTQDYAFDSPSGASTAIVGAETNGRAVWKVKGTGQSYKDWLDARVTAASDDDARPA
jgi:hypothetical protein